MNTVSAIGKFLAGCLFLLQASCSLEESMKKAEPCVTRFRQQFDAEQFSEMYNQAGPRYRGATTEAENSELMRAIHTKLGAMSSSRQVGVFVNSGTEGTIVKSTYETQYAGGSATETFLIDIGGPRCEIVGYNIQSRALVLK